VNSRAEEYRDLRRALGTQEQVAPLIGITVQALSLREMGHSEIRQEAFLALQLLIAIRQKRGHVSEIQGIRSV